MIPVSDKLAVLFPVFNGGDRLAESVRSCAHAGLRGSDYEIIVLDNCSTDGSPDRLPSIDDNGARVQLHRNSTNIGRVGNWNRSVQMALDQGFRYATFLFVGDEWIRDGSLPGLLNCMRESGPALGMSPFLIANERGEITRSSQRFYTSDADIVTATASGFLSTLLNSGLFPLGPLQANIYRLSPEHTLRFDETAPTVTDVRATLDFIQRSRRDIAFASRPFVQWREHAGRFHASMGPAQTIRDYFETFHLACETTKIRVNHSRAKARVMLNCARLIAREAPVNRWPRLARDLFGQSSSSPYKSNPFYLLEALWLRFALGRHQLEVG